MHKKDIYNLSGMLQEIGRQPGIAWLAIVNEKGTILLDSNEELNNTQLYSSAEMRALAASDVLQGRFSPDDPDIYETWKLFQPWRLASGRRPSPGGIIFIAIDASFIQEELDDLALRLCIFALSLSIGLLLLISLTFYIYKFIHSRAKLAETEAFAFQIFESYHAALLICDTRGDVLLYNPNAKKLFEIRPGIKNLNISEIAFFDWNHVFQIISQKSFFEAQEMELHLKRGQAITVNLSASRVKGSLRPKYLLAFRELGEINLLKKKLAHSEKLSEVGRLASGLAHEIRNPLSAIRGYAVYLQSRLENDQMGQAAAKLLGDETARINDAVSGLLNIIRQPRLNLEKNNLEKLIKKAADIIQPDAKAANVKIDLKIPASRQDKWPLTDKDKILQTLLNLFLNGIQAMPGGGSLQVELKEHLDRQNSAAGWDIIIRDTGKGMSEEIRRQIFNPYFTTRASGTGLGLAISRQIAESHNGSLEAASQPAHGSIFTLFLPFSDSQECNDSHSFNR